MYFCVSWAPNRGAPGQCRRTAFLAQQLLQIANGEIDSVFYDTDPGDLEEGSLFLQITKVQAEGRRNP